MDGKTVKAVFASVLLFIILQPGIAHSKKMEIFVDVCNSYEGADKLGILKEGLSKFIKENPGISVSVKMFGFPLQGENEKRLSGALTGGKVTKVESLYNSISMLTHEESVHVIISGGKGNWDEIKTLIREKEATKLYVIGVSLPNPDLMYKLLGVASLSGGKYFNVNNSGTLADVLSEIEKSAGYNLEVKVYKNTRNELTDYLVSRYKYVWSSEVYESGKRDKAIQATSVFPARFNLPSGLYDVKVRYADNIKWIEGIRVENLNLTRKAVNFAKGLLFVKVFNSGHPVAGVDKGSDYCWYAEAYDAGRREKPVEVTKTFPPEFNLTNGRYDIKVHYRGYEKWFYDVDIREDGTTNLEYTFPHAESCAAAAVLR